MFVHKVASKTLKGKFQLQWYITEQDNGRILNQIVVGEPEDEYLEWEPTFDINLDCGTMKETRRLWGNLVKLVDLLKEEPK